MATAEKVVRTIEQVEKVVLTLTEQEAKALRALTGMTAGGSSYGQSFYDIYRALGGAGIDAVSQGVELTYLGAIRLK